MKCMIALIAASAMVVSVSAFDTYLAELPNSDQFDKSLGHGAGKDKTEFGKAFSELGGKWTPEACGTTIDSWKMTIGEAFGDPCCEWKAGAKAMEIKWEKNVPVLKTVCEKNKGGASAATAGAPTPTKSSETATKTKDDKEVDVAPEEEKDEEEEEEEESPVGTEQAAADEYPAETPSMTPAAAVEEEDECTVEDDEEEDDDDDDEDEDEEE